MSDPTRPRGSGSTCSAAWTIWGGTARLRPVGHSGRAPSGGAERGVPGPGRGSAATRRTSVYLSAAMLRRLKELALAATARSTTCWSRARRRSCAESGHLPSPVHRDTS